MGLLKEDKEQNERMEELGKVLTVICVKYRIGELDRNVLIDAIGNYHASGMKYGYVKHKLISSEMGEILYREGEEPKKSWWKRIIGK